MRLKILFCLSLIANLCSCINFSASDRTRELGGDTKQLIRSSGKTAQISLSYTLNETGNLDKHKSNNSNPLLEVRVAEALENEFNFKCVHAEPTKYQAIISPEKFKDDYLLKFYIEETNEDPETLLQTIFRGLSFGYYPQKMIKKMKYSLNIEDKTTKKQFSLSTQVEKIYTYQAPMLVIPFNLDHHPFTIVPQSTQHIEEIKKLIRMAISR